MAKFVDPNFKIDNICFNAKAFKDKCVNAKPYTAIIFDEAFRGLSSRGAMSKLNKNLVRIFNEVRQLNLFLIIVIPSYFELDKYPAIHRSRALYHVRTDKEMKRGYFSAYNQKRMKYLYLNGKQKAYSYYHPKGPNYYGRFTKKYMVEEKAYKRMKLDAFRKDEEEETKPKKRNRYEQKLVDYIVHKHDTYDWSFAEIGKELNIPKATTYDLYKGAVRTT